MNRGQFIIVVLLMSLRLNSQTHYYHYEIQAGYSGMFFFDKAPFRFQSLLYTPIPTSYSFSYRYKINQGIKVIYNNLTVSGANSEPYEGKVLLHNVINYSGMYQYYFNNNKKIGLISNVGFSYRRGEDLIFVTYNYSQNGTKWEQILDNIYYKDFGLLLGVESKIFLFKRISIGLNLEYEHYFSKRNKNTINGAVLIGFHF